MYSNYFQLILKVSLKVIETFPFFREGNTFIVGAM